MRNTRAGSAVAPVPIRAVLYLRLSDLRDDDLDNDGTGKTFSDREQDLRDYVEDIGGEVVDVIIENDVSSRDGKHRNASAFKRRKVTLKDGTQKMRVVRPGFDKVVSYLESGFANMLVTEDSDRITRDMYDGMRLIEIVETKKLNVRTLTGAFTLTNGGTDTEIGAAWDCVNRANQESRKTANRVRRGRKRKARRGEFGGGRRPFGFEADGVTVRPLEARVLADCARRVLEIDSVSGKPLSSLRALAAELRAGYKLDGERVQVPTVTGTQWSAETLRDVLLRDRNAGHMIYDGEIIGAAPWPPLVDPEVHAAVVAKLTDPARRTGPGSAPKWQGSGVYLCGVCNDGTTCQVTRAGRAPTYKCSKFNHLRRQVAHVDAMVDEVVTAVLSRDDAVDLFTPERPDVDTAALRAERTAIRENLKGMAADRALGLMSREAMLEGTARGQARVDEIRAILDAAAISTSPAAELATADDVEAEWKDTPLATRQAVIRDLITVTILPAGRRGAGFDPTTVRIADRRLTLAD